MPMMRTCLFLLHILALRTLDIKNKAVSPDINRVHGFLYEKVLADIKDIVSDSFMKFVFFGAVGRQIQYNMCDVFPITNIAQFSF